MLPTSKAKPYIGVSQRESGLTSEHIFQKKKKGTSGSSLMLSKVQIWVYLHRIRTTPIQTAANTSTNTITATPVSRPRSEDDQAPGSSNGLPLGSLDELLALG